jgi:hypothetical protein
MLKGTCPQSLQQGRTIAPTQARRSHMTTFYRFRSIDNLLGTRKELESQSIYFASLEQLNDPMEGYRDFF